MSTNSLSLARKLDNDVTVLSPTIASTYQLPSAANALGKVYTIINSGTAELTVQASDATSVVVVQASTSAVVTSNVDTPTTNTHFTVINGVLRPGATGSLATTASGNSSGVVGQTVSKTGSFGPMSAGTNTSQIYSTTIAAGVWLAVGNINLLWSAAPIVSNYPLVTITGSVKQAESSRQPAKPALGFCTDYFPVVGSFVSTGSNAFTLNATNFSTAATVTFGIDLTFTRIA